MKESIDNPGIVFTVLAIPGLIIGIMAGILTRSGWPVAAGILAAIVLMAVSMILNRLERIAHHLEHLREKFENKNPS